MPAWAQAKPWKPGQREAHQAEMRAFFARLERKIFPHDREDQS
jgi:hypothetical protein